MPKEFEDLVQKLKKKPDVQNPYALAHYIENQKEGKILPFTIASMKLGSLSDTQRNQFDEAYKEILNNKINELIEKLGMEYQMKTEIDARLSKNPDDKVLLEELRRKNQEIEFLLGDIIQADNRSKGKPYDYVSPKIASHLATLKSISTKIAVDANLPRPSFTTVNLVNDYAFTKLPNKREQGAAASQEKDMHKVETEVNKYK